MSVVFRAMSAFFDRDNIALPGCSLLFKVYSQIEINDVWFFTEFLTKRGQHPQMAGHAAPPKDFTRGKETSDVLYCFEKALALIKVQYCKVNDLYKAAAKTGDAHAMSFSTYLIAAVVVQSDKHAIKEFDRRLPYEIEDLGKSTGAEAVIPNRLMIDCVMRSIKAQAKVFNADCYDDVKARRVFNQVV
ncbi:hypothetical protein WJX72_011504 [[Myrmecia] bisecta]|uniref:Uncharacterized protein n=1 Tax=[Myrmecia] bisecta TaxID=41462 RepID=A0AAW1PQF1_9CHLO